MAHRGDDHVPAHAGPTDPDSAPRRPRVLIYSHDTFGLGHLRRSRAIANALVQDNPDLSAVIVSGSPVIGSFEFGSGVDYVRVPGVTKLADGNYRALNLNMSIEEATRLREELILQTARSFRPDVFIVDKEPAGFRGEVVPALRHLSAEGCRLVLGIRDVMDDPELLVPEWERKDAAETLARFYDEVWVYGLAEIYRPLEGLDLPDAVADRTVYTGYLRRELPLEPNLADYPGLTRQPFILVTTGGGGDGDDVIDWVISAYEADPGIDLPAVVVFGPFINRERRRGFMERIARHPKLDAIAFDTKLELLMSRAAAVVAMGGYNTFCEVLSLDRPALIVPRTEPRREQLIRAKEAERLGLSSMLVVDGAGSRDPLAWAAPSPSAISHQVSATKPASEKGKKPFIGRCRKKLRRCARCAGNIASPRLRTPRNRLSLVESRAT